MALIEINGLPGFTVLKKMVDLSMAKSNKCNKWPDGTNGRCSHVWSAHCLFRSGCAGHARRVLSLAERGPHFGPSTLEFCFRIPPKNDDFCGRCLSFRNDFIWVVAQKWWLWMVKLWRFHQKESGHCIRFPAGTRRFWSLPISDPTDRQLDSIILQLWVWENK